jgi:hypothetical protein
MDLYISLFFSAFYQGASYLFPTSPDRSSALDFRSDHPLKGSRNIYYPHDEKRLRQQFVIVYGAALLYVLTVFSQLFRNCD